MYEHRICVMRFECLCGSGLRFEFNIIHHTDCMQEGCVMEPLSIIHRLTVW